MIRKAKLAEIQDIIKITRACAAKMTSEGVIQWNEYYPNAEAFQKDVQREELYVLTTEDAIIGCITISSEKDSEYDEIEWLTKDASHYYIHRLAIHPGHQKKGYAKRLMDFAEALAQENNIDSIRLDTFSQNHHNQKFYENRDYTRLGNVYFPNQSKDPFYCYELLIKK